MPFVGEIFAQLNAATDTTVLQEIRDVTGLPISEALKQGLQSLKQRVGEEAGRRPYDLYKQLDLGPGGYPLDAV